MDSSRLEDVAHLADLLSQHPIMESLVEQINIWDLIQLSRTNSVFRALCHGIPRPRPVSDSDWIRGTRIRKSLNVGLHDTKTWRLYRKRTLKTCSESDHTKGSEVKGCKLCSKPVCIACVVKHSFGKDENTFLNRGRALCRRCFLTGNPHSDHISVSGTWQIHIEYGKLGLCNCTSRDGILCIDCKKKQNEDSVSRFKGRCAGAGCTETIDPTLSHARVCLWCECVLPTAGQRSQYDTSLALPSFMTKDYAPVRRRWHASQATEEAANTASMHTQGLPPSQFNLEISNPQEALVPQTQDIEQPHDAEDIPAYSQYPIDSIPAYHFSQLQAGE